VILADVGLKKMYQKNASAPLFTPLADGSAFASLTGERVKLRRGEPGLGFRPLGERFLFLNSLNTTKAQALNRKDKNGTIVPGLWNSLPRQLGVNSFDPANGDTC
jgi:hypothetical protein